MIMYILRRLGTGIVVFVSVTTMTFFLLHMRGAEAIARNVVGPQAPEAQVTAEIRTLQLDQPLVLQFFSWFGRILRGNLGTSYVSMQPVNQILATRTPVTLSLVVVSLILTAILSVLLGVGAATRGGVVDRGLQILSVIVQAIPGYWLALVLVLVFGVALRLVPATGYIPITTSFTGWLSTVILPSIAVAMGNVAAVGQQIRGAMLDAQRKDFVRTLRARGISRRAIVFRHLLRAAAPPGLTVLSLQVIAALGGVVIVETIYALPGIGALAVSSGLQGDIPVVLGILTVVVVIVMVVNLLVDILNGLLSPRARTR